MQTEITNIEAAVLQHILAEPDALYRIRAYLTVEDFLSVNGAQAYATMCKLAQDKVKVTVDLLQASIQAEWAECLMPIKLDGSNLDYCLQQLKGETVYKQIKDLVTQLKHMVAQKTKAEDILLEVKSSLDTISQGYYSYRGSTDVILPDQMSSLIQEEIAVRRKHPGIYGLKTGFPILDECIKGLKPVTVVSGYTKAGKSALALNIAVNLGIHQDIPCLFINCEMPVEEILFRVVAILSDIPLDALLTGDITEDVEALLHKTYDKIRASKLLLTTDSSKRIEHTIDLIYRYHISDRIQCVVIDYLGEIKPSREELQETMFERYGNWVQQIKDACVDLGIKSIIVTQLNRAHEVQGSFLIAQKSNVFLTIGKEFKKGKPDKHGKDIITIKWNRGGPSDIQIPIIYNRTTQQIVEAI